MPHTTPEPLLSRWRDPQRLGPLTALLAFAGSAAAVGSVLLLDRCLGGLAVFPRLIEIALDKLGIVKWLLLFPPPLLRWLRLPLEEAVLLPALAQQSWLQSALLMVVAVPVVHKWIAPAWAFHACSRPDSMVLARLPEATGLTPWILPEDPQVGQARQRLLDWLTSLVAPAPVWRWWLPWRQPRPADPLSVMLLLGPNGVGKSQLAWEMAKAVGLAGLGAVGNRSWDVGEWHHDDERALSGLDAQVPSLPSAGAMANLRRWRPRRPTLLLLDEPGVGAAGLVLDTLQVVADQFRYPVALLVVDQVTPAELAGRMARAVGAAAAARRPFAPQGGSVRLGQVQLTVNDVRKLGSLFQRQRNAAPAFLPNLYGEGDLQGFVEATRGEPLTVALGVHELAAHPGWSVTRWRATDPALAESNLGKLPPDALRHRLIKARAEDLIDTWTEGQPEVEAHARLLDAIAAASLVGGLALDGPLRSQATLADLDPRRLERLFPGAVASGRLPGFGGPMIQDAALTVWLARSLAPQARAQHIVALAWAESPSRAARAALRRPHLPLVLLEALFSRLDHEEMTVALLLEQLRAAVHDPAILPRARVAIERLPAAALAGALTGAAALLFEAAEVAAAPLARLELLALLAQRGLRSSCSAAADDAVQLDAVIECLARAQAAVGAYASWLDDAAQAAAAALQTVLELCLARWPIRQWRLEQLEALQAGWIDPLLSEPLDCHATRLLDLLSPMSPDTAAAGQEELVALRPYQALWRTLQDLARRSAFRQGPNTEEAEGLELGHRSKAAEASPLRQDLSPDVAARMRLRLAVAAHFNQAVDPFIMDWPCGPGMPAIDKQASGVGSEPADPLRGWLWQAAELLPQWGLAGRRQVARWCAQGLRGRLFALTSAPERSVASVESALRQILDRVPSAERPALKAEMDVLFAALGGVCALWDCGAKTLEAAAAAASPMPAVPAPGAMDDVWWANHAADAWALAVVVKSIHAPPPAGPDGFAALHEAALGSVDPATWAGAAYVSHAGVRAARLVALERLLKAAINSTADVQAQRALLAPQIDSWLDPLRHGTGSMRQAALQCAALACLSECVALMGRKPQGPQARSAAVEMAQQVEQWAVATSLQSLKFPGFWRARAWYYVIHGCTQRLSSVDGLQLSGPGAQPATDDDFNLAQALFRRELTETLPTWLAGAPPGKFMRALAASQVVALAGFLKDSGRAIATAYGLFKDEFLPALREYPSAATRQPLLLQTVTNLLVAIKNREIGEPELALARQLYADQVEPVLAQMPPSSVEAAEEALKARSVYIEITLGQESGTEAWFERALTQQQAVQAQFDAWGPAYLTGPALGGLAIAAGHLMQTLSATLPADNLLSQADLDRMDAFVERHIHSLAQRIPIGSGIWIEFALALAWRHCAFLSHQLRRSDLTGVYAARLVSRFTADRFPMPLHPALALELARVLDYHASTLCLCGEHAHGLSVIQGDLRRLADNGPDMPGLQFAWAEAVSMALKSCPPDEPQLARHLLDDLASAVARVADEHGLEGRWLNVIHESHRAVQARWPDSAAGWWRAADLPELEPPNS